MENMTAEHPFAFVGCWGLREMLGRSARDERQLLEAIEEVPLDSIYYHTHSCAAGTGGTYQPGRHGYSRAGKTPGQEAPQQAGPS